MGEWQPIETAPLVSQDGRPSKIIVYIPSLSDGGRQGLIEIATWDDDKHATWPRPFWRWGFRATWCRDNPPTLWMALPDRPKEPANG